VVTKYETVFVLDPSFDEAKAGEEADRVTGVIGDLGGEVVEVQKWGKRRLAYEIRKKRDGVYTMIVWNGSGGMVKEVERRLRQNENVMRVLTTLYVPPELSQGVPEGEAVAAGSDNGDDD
jgi:small subunit ribosomal protein S6